MVREMQKKAAEETALKIDKKAATRRIVISEVFPQVDDGRYPAKFCVGDRLEVSANVFTDGHSELSVDLEIRPPQGSAVVRIPMRPLGNDRWSAEHSLTIRGAYTFIIIAWRNDFATWLSDARKRITAQQPMETELEQAKTLLAEGLRNASGSSAEREFQELVARVCECSTLEEHMSLLGSAETRRLFRTAGPRAHEIVSEQDFPLIVERKRAGFGAWYELMPRSLSAVPGQHGTFDDVIEHLPYVGNMGFDVLYFPPIHPIGTTHRKGRNNSLSADEGDPGSPYAIGSPEGGHDAMHPELGDFEDFERLIAAARDAGLEVALDFAIQCSPDHPWIKEHPEWFKWRSDGSIRFAENPPKKYEDIVNVEFYGAAFPRVWFALRDIVLFWVEKGVKIFRVDNPHTKPFPFWEWLINEIRAQDPDVIFLSEAFTRPNIMEYLAKIGFTQSYSYFTWRNTKQELTEYLTELTKGPSSAYMRPNFFVNTPDINPYYLQTGGRAAFQARLILAASLGTNYGIYSGFELCEAEALPGKEEYADSEKYQLKQRDWDRPGHIREDVERINHLRQTSAALHDFKNVRFYNAWNDNILYYGKATKDLRDFLLFAVNLDPRNPQGAHFEVPLWEFGMPDEASIEVDDLINGQRFTWTGKVQHVYLDPAIRPYAIWRLHGPGGAA
jgi:starch synthase (maltosyl-transferring)